MIRIWDRGFHLLHALDETIAAERVGDWKKFTLPADHPAALWLVDNPASTVYVTIESAGFRWHGALNQWEMNRNPCPNCQDGRKPGLTVLCEPAVVVPAWVMDYTRV
jgi:hypothetical protein